MLIQGSDEKRIDYLLRALNELMHNTGAGDCMVEYDETECDGMCLADEIADEVLLLTMDEP